MSGDKARREELERIEREAKIIVVLERALALLKRGWIQGAYCRLGPDSPPRYCVAGAINAASGLQPPESVWTLAHQALRDELFCDVEDWNDSPERTWNDVLDLFSSTIAKLKERQPTCVMTLA